MGGGWGLNFVLTHSLLRNPERPPQLLRRERRVRRVATQSIRDRVGDRRRRADCSALTDPLRAQRVVRRGRLHERCGDRRHLGRTGQAVIGERGAYQLAVAVVDRLLHQDGAESLNDAAEHLALGQQRVDDRACIINGGQPSDGQRAGGAVDLDHRRVRARPEYHLGLEPDLRVEAAHAGRDFGQRDRPAGPSARGLLQDPIRRLHERGAAHRNGAAGERAHTRGHLRRITKAHLNVVDVDPEPVGNDLRERRVVPLAVRGRTAPGDHAAVRAHRDPRALPAAPGALDVHRDPGADRASLLAATLRLGTQQLDRQIQAALVVARVVGEPERAVVWKDADQVAPPQLNPVEAQLAGCHVDRALEQVGRLGPTRAAIGTGRHLVGACAPDRDRGRRDVVAAGHQHRGGVGRDRGGRKQVRPQVGQDRRPEGQDPSGGVQPKLDLALDPPTLIGPEEVLHPVLDPLERPPQLHRGDRQRDRLDRDRPLAAERPAHVGHYHADALSRPHQGVGELRERPVGILRRDPEGQTVIVGVVGDERAAWLDRRGHQAGDPVAGAHAVRGARQQSIDVAGYPLPAHQRLGGRPRVDDRLERLVLDLDQLGRVHRLRARLRHHRRHRLSGVADLLRGQDRVRLVSELGALGPAHRQRSRPSAQIDRGEHPQQPGSARRHADAENPRPRVVATHERDVREAREIEIVDVAALPSHQRQVLPPAQRPADHPAGASRSAIQSPTSGR